MLPGELRMISSLRMISGFEPAFLITTFAVEVEPTVVGANRIGPPNPHRRGASGAPPCLSFVAKLGLD